MTREKQRGRLVVISGPSGVGKTTVADRLCARPGFARAITATTRAPREGERDGVDYRFLDEDVFRASVRNGEFLEHALVHGRHYGTPRDSVEAILASGRSCLLVIDVQGAASLRRSRVPATYVFIAPPSEAELERRLRARRTEPEAAVQARLAAAKTELARRVEFDTVVINDDLDRVVGEIQGLAEGRRP